MRAAVDAVVLGGGAVDLDIINGNKNEKVFCFVFFELFLCFDFLEKSDHSAGRYWLVGEWLGVVVSWDWLEVVAAAHLAVAVLKTEIIGTGGFAAEHGVAIRVVLVVIALMALRTTCTTGRRRVACRCN